jgi:phage tail-like protein
MPAGDPKTLYPIEHWRLKVGGAEATGLFLSATMPGLSLTSSELRSVGEKSSPEVTTVPVTHRWSDLSLVKGVDAKGELYTWIAQSLTPDGGGGGKVEKKEVTVELCTAEDAPVITWTLRGAWPSSYQGPGLDANSASHAMESITFSFDTAEVKYKEGA